MNDFEQVKNERRGVVIFKCTPIDGYQRLIGPKGKPANEFCPVYIRSETPENIEQIERVARYWLGIKGYRGKYNVHITPYKPLGNIIV